MRDVPRNLDDKRDMESWLRSLRERVMRVFKHSELDDVEGADKDSTDTTKDKHISNYDLKKIEDHMDDDSKHIGSTLSGSANYISDIGAGSTKIAIATPTPSTRVIDVAPQNIDHAELKADSIGVNSHSQIDSHLSSNHVNQFNGRTGTVTPATNDYTWAQINKATSDLADITTKSHTSLSDIGSSTHVQIDDHIANTATHFTEASINHTNIQNVGTNTHATIDTFISSKGAANGLASLDASSKLVQAANDDTSIQKVSIWKDAGIVGSRKSLNIQAGSNVTWTIADDAANNRVNLRVDSSPGISAEDFEGVWGNASATSSTSVFTLVAKAIKLRSPSNDTVVRNSPANITCNVGTAGPAANSRDQSAAFPANSWIFFYWIWNGSTLASIASLDEFQPTLPTGYTHSCLCSAVRFNASSQLEFVRTRGGRVYYDVPKTALAAGTSTVEAQINLSSYIPPNTICGEWFASCEGKLGTGAGGGGGGDAAIRYLTGANYVTMRVRVSVASDNNLVE